MRDSPAARRTERSEAHRRSFARERLWPLPFSLSVEHFSRPLLEPPWDLWSTRKVRLSTYFRVPRPTSPVTSTSRRPLAIEGRDFALVVFVRQQIVLSTDRLVHGSLAVNVYILVSRGNLGELS